MKFKRTIEGYEVPNGAQWFAVVMDAPVNGDDGNEAVIQGLFPSRDQAKAWQEWAFSRRVDVRLELVIWP